MAAIADGVDLGEVKVDLGFFASFHHLQQLYVPKKS